MKQNPVNNTISKRIKHLAFFAEILFCLKIFRNESSDEAEIVHKTN